MSKAAKSKQNKQWYFPHELVFSGLPMRHVTQVVSYLNDFIWTTLFVSRVEPFKPWSSPP